MIAKLAKRTSFIAILIIIALLLFFQPWQRKKMILTINIPNSSDTLELWEKPEVSILSLSTEYSTWLVVRSGKDDPKLHIIDEQYIILKKVSVFINDDQKQIRIETGENKEKTHLIAEYNFSSKFFIAKSEDSVRNKQGWILMTEKVIR